MPKINFILICTICKREKSDKTGRRFCNCEREEYQEPAEPYKGVNPFEGDDIMEFIMGHGWKK
jgi:hypothetical protein